MIVVALVFYAVVGMFVGALILHWLGLLPEEPKTGQQSASSPAGPATPGKPEVKAIPLAGLFVLACAVGVPLGLAWLGGTYGSGNALFPKGGNAAQTSYQPGYTQQPAGGEVWVNPYFRADGTFVPGHWRTTPDGDPSNNGGAARQP